MMWNAVEAADITLPGYVSRDRLEYAVSCEKVNQSISVRWRQKLADGSTPLIPREHGFPTYTVYGKRAELKMRGIEGGVTEIVQALYGTGITVVPIKSQKWTFDAAMGAPEENIEIPDEVAAQVQGETTNAREFNEQVRESGEIVANVDKGFVRCVSQFRDDLPATEVIRAEKGHQGEFGWGVHFEQGRHRCILAGTAANRPEEEAWDDTLWTACAEWANFMPKLGQSKIHVENLWTPNEFTHIFEQGKYEQAIGSVS
jgi:hypothetical protein